MSTELRRYATIDQTELRPYYSDIVNGSLTDAFQVLINGHILGDVHKRADRISDGSWWYMDTTYHGEFAPTLTQAVHNILNASNPLPEHYFKGATN